MLPVERGRHGHQLIIGRDRVFGETAAHAPVHAIPGAKCRHTGADCMHDAGRFGAADFLGAAMDRAADHELTAIHRSRMHAQHDFAGPGLGLCDIAPFEYCLMVSRNDPAGFHAGSDSVNEGLASRALSE